MINSNTSADTSDIHFDSLILDEELANIEESHENFLGYESSSSETNIQSLGGTSSTTSSTSEITKSNKISSQALGLCEYHIGQCKNNYMNYSIINCEKCKLEKKKCFFKNCLCKNNGILVTTNKKNCFYHVLKNDNAYDVVMRYSHSENQRKIEKRASNIL